LIDFQINNTAYPENGIVGFVYGQTNTFAIYENEVAYIVGEKGQTIERIYGIYQKS